MNREYKMLDKHIISSSDKISAIKIALKDENISKDIFNYLLEIRRKSCLVCGEVLEDISHYKIHDEDEGLIECLERIHIIKAIISNY